MRPGQVHVDGVYLTMGHRAGMVAGIRLSAAILFLCLVNLDYRFFRLV